MRQGLREAAKEARWPRCGRASSTHTRTRISYENRGKLSLDSCVRHSLLSPLFEPCLPLSRGRPLTAAFPCSLRCSPVRALLQHHHQRQSAVSFIFFVQPSFFLASCSLSFAIYAQVSAPSYHHWQLAAILDQATN